jgi:subtilase family serine protease
MSFLKAVLVTFMMFVVSASFAQPSRNRVTRAITEESTVGLRGNVHPMVKYAARLGSLDADTQLERVMLMFRPTAEQQQKLTALLEEQQNPSSANYHKWLTPTQYADQFGLSTADLAKVRAWLTSKGLSVVDVSSSRTWIAVNGTSAQVASAFRTSLQRYAANGTTFFANSSDPVIPSALSGIVGEIRGLNSIKPKPRVRMTRKVVAPHFTSSISGNHFLAPDDVATIYDLQSLYNNALDGSGQKIVVVGQTNMLLSDVAAFRAASGLTANAPQLILVPGSGDPGIVAGDIDEASLDVEWSGAIARKANILYVYSKNGVFDSMIYAISNNLAPVISISYGGCEAQYSSSDISTLTSLGNQANVQGQTIVGASGDSGAADCDDSIASAFKGLAVDIPAALPSVTGIGGTTFNDASGTYWNSSNNSLSGSAISYIPEVAWNDTAADGALASTGGGKSVKFGKPSWQIGTGVPADGGRDVPDVSFSASVDHDGYLYCVQGGCVNGYRAADQTLSVVGGTSAGAPLFAGVVAILNQKTTSMQGNVNPTLYSLGVSSPSIYHDIVAGDNIVPCTTGTPNCTTGTMGYSAGIGYDLVTGLGTVDVGALVASWPSAAGSNPNFSFTATNTSLTFNRGSSATSSLTVAALNGFTGTVTLSCTTSAALTGTTCAVAPSTVTTSGTATLTVSHPSTTSKNVPGGNLFFSLTGGVAALCLAVGQQSSRRRLRMLGLTLLLAVGALTLVNCGGGGSSSSSNSNPGSSLTAQTGTVTVTAVNGALTHTVQVAVTVN